MSGNIILIPLGPWNTKIRFNASYLFESKCPSGARSIYLQDALDIFTGELDNIPKHNMWP